MTTTTLIQEINRLPLPDKLLVVEQTLKSIRAEKAKQLNEAVDALHDEYKTNIELTAFTNLDKEPFYEAR